MKPDKGVGIVLIHLLLQIQASKAARYCPEAVDSAEYVTSCPSTKSEWDTAAQKKNCSKVALHQNCSTIKEFQYHCVLNGYRNKMVEVCAPSRIIIGHCVEFNLLGGVIQDQMSSPCNDTFPKCDVVYRSTAAYKYPGCYDLVSKFQTKADTTTKIIFLTTNPTTDISRYSIVVIASSVTVVMSLLIIAFGVMLWKKKRKSIKTTNVEREQLNKHGSKYDTSKEQLEERNTNLDGINSDSDVEALVTATCIQSENEMVLQPGYGYINYQVAQDNKYGNKQFYTEEWKKNASEKIYSRDSAFGFPPEDQNIDKPIPNDDDNKNNDTNIHQTEKWNLHYVKEELSEKQLQMKKSKTISRGE